MYITKWNHTPIRMPLIHIQSIKSKLDAPHHITLNDIDICFITETWINIDHDLQLLEANISGLGYKLSINIEKINQEEVLHVYTKGAWAFKPALMIMHTLSASYVSLSVTCTRLYRAYRPISLVIGSKKV